MDIKQKELCQSGKLQFRILAPSGRDVPGNVSYATRRSAEHGNTLYGLQKLRGDVYREYAGIAATLLPDGRHWHHLDEGSWHIVLEDDGEVVGCARYRLIQTFDQLICSKAAVALSPVTGPVFRSSFAQMMGEARHRGIHVGEASAWALSEKARCSTAAVNIALMSFALADWLGGGVGLTTASTRHHASLILRRLGGSPLAGFAPYYEPMFDCSIELLQFDISQVEPRYARKLAELKEVLRNLPILCPPEAKSREPEYVPAFPLGHYLPAHHHLVSAGLALN